jgi:hypothetical protein
VVRALGVLIWTLILVASVYVIVRLAMGDTYLLPLSNVRKANASHHWLVENWCIVHIQNAPRQLGRQSFRSYWSRGSGD